MFGSKKLRDGLEIYDHISFHKMCFSSSRIVCEIVTDIRGLSSPI